MLFSSVTTREPLPLGGHHISIQKNNQPQVTQINVVSKERRRGRPSRAFPRYWRVSLAFVDVRSINRVYARKHVARHSRKPSTHPAPPSPWRAWIQGATPAPLVPPASPVSPRDPSPPGPQPRLFGSLEVVLRLCKSLVFFLSDGDVNVAYAHLGCCRL